MTAVPVEIVPLAEPQVDAAGDAMARAFDADPLECYAMPDAADRARRSPQRFRTLVRLGLLFGETVTTPETADIAFWFRPGDEELDEERLAATGMDRSAEIMGTDAWERFFAVIQVLDESHERDASGPHWHLALLGVDKPLQGRGMGAALIEPGLARADAEGLPCYLETPNPVNRAFYERFGFRVVTDKVERVSRLRLLTMWREPRGVA